MKEVYIWGMGSFYRSCIDKLESYKIKGYIDNSLCTTCEEYKGKKVLSSADIDSDMDILIMSKNFVPMIYELIEKNIENIDIGVYIFPESWQEQLLSMYGKFIIDNGKLLYRFKYQNETLEIRDNDVLKELYKKLVDMDNLSKKIELLPLRPVCRDFGISRGTPIDRVYIERFLSKNQDMVRGDVLEISENTYTLKYGGDQLRKSYILHVKGWGENAILGNLETGEGILDNQYDTAIITQTLMFIYNIFDAVQNIYRMLRPGGVALITVAGISQISRYDAENWGSYWGFQVQSVRKLFESVFNSDKICIESYGNVQSATAMLYGMCAEELSEHIFEYNDPQYPVILGIKVEKEKE